MTSIRNIKAWICVVCLATSMAAPAPGPSGPLALDIIDMAAISRMSPQQLEKLAEGLAAEEIMRTKRSSAQALTSVVSKASSGLQSKVSFLSQASALIGSASSKSGNEEHTGYSYEPEPPKVDYWGLKKSILYTLFQAVKAITGGVTILKGQLIKGGGHLAATLGKVISGKGDAVSNLGKKIVSSAALSQKKPSPPVYGPPPTSHGEYGPPPSAYGAPTAPAHYSHTGPSAPSGYGANKYPAHLDDSAVYQNIPLNFNEIGRATKLNGVHAGLVILTPLNEASPSETLETAHSGHTPLDPPPSIINSVYSAFKNAFTPASPSYHDETALLHQPPPPPQPAPPFRPMAWGALNSYGEPAQAEAFPDYDPRHPHRQFDHASSKLSIVPTPVKHHRGLTADKVQKITYNLNKLAEYMNQNVQRSSEDLPQINPQFGNMLKNGLLPMLPTPVVTDNEIGVLPADLLPSDPPTTTTSTTTSSTTTSTTTEKPKNTTESEKNRRKKDVKYILRGNKIVQV